ncbi:MAG: ABC transporter permease [Bacteroidaceae bacterium]|nr:ABC transporter permease [Bacteroidaceae bacterium]MBQ7967167.1 ABC transporter permease [Bacteroidaceae bacterium]
METFIARRLYKSEQGSRNVSRPAVFIAQLGVALGLAVMLVTIAVSFGFKHEVRDKAVGFSSHLHISNYESAQSYEALPVAADSALWHTLTAMPEVSHVQRYATKAGVFRTDDDFMGYVLKGVGEDYDLSFYAQYLQEGELPQFSDSVASGKILISREIASKLQLGVGDRVDSYFLQGNMRARRYTVAGIYQTGFSEYDRVFALTDLKAVQALNRWEPDQVTGVEVMLTGFDEVEPMNWELGSLLDRTQDSYGEQYFVQSVTDLNPGLFAWLDVLDMNVLLILVLMVGVAAFTMISGLLILIIERTQFIGVLKALGASNGMVRKTFLYLAMLIIGKGMLWGNVVGLALCALQKFTRLVTLNPQDYYLDCVPIEFNWPLIVTVNVVMFVLSVLILIVPSHLISRIYPTKAMRFE